MPSATYSLEGGAGLQTYSGSMPRAVGMRVQTFSKAAGYGKKMDRNSFSFSMLPDLSQPVSSSSVTSKQSISPGWAEPAQARCPKMIFCFTTAPLVEKDAALALSFDRALQMDRPASDMAACVLHTFSKPLWGFHFSLKRPSGFQRRAFWPSLAGGFGRAALRSSAGPPGGAPPGFATTPLNSSVASTAAANSSRLMTLSRSESMYWNTALTCSGQRAESLTTL
mmetsp:Transcript_90479/g.281697  ORF Transcript_90479/g.281697 Transcript_90479/m.281697 type:complete len:224 (+) Transcript_90479:386-1057(+)